MAQKYANAARAELAATINDTDAALEIVEGGALFPVADTGASAISDAADWFKLTLQDDTGYEIIFVRTHTSGSVNFTNILRGQEGTTAREFLAGSVVGLRPTAGDAESYATNDGLATSAATKQDRIDSLAITYNVDGTIDTVAENGVTKTFAYNLDGTINTVSWSVGLLTRAETYSYTNGVLTGMTATEV